MPPFNSSSNSNPLQAVAQPLPDQPAESPSPGQAPKPPKKRRSSTRALMQRANTVSGVVAMLVVISLVGGVVGYLIAGSRTKTVAPTKTTVTSLSADDLAKLGDVSSGVGDTGQILNVQSAATFKQKVDVGGDLSVGGRLNANGPVTLSQLNITGTTALSGLNVGSNLTVTGNTTLQKGASITGLLSVNGGLNVSGATSLSSLNAGSISTQSLAIAGPLTVGHLQTQGTAPTAAAGAAVGSGGTASVSGNDTAGTINVNTGGGPAAGTLISVTFRAPYGTTPHVTLTALTGAAASVPVYVTRTATGFAVRTDAAAPAGATLAYDFIVVQ